MTSPSIRTRLRVPHLLAAGLVAFAIGCDKDTKPAATAPSGAGKTAAADGGAAPAKVGEPDGEEAAADAGGAKVKVVEGAPAGDDERYALQVETPEATAGKEGQVTVRVVPKDPWHMNLDFPTSLEVAAPAGVEVAKAAQKKADALELDEDSCAFAVKFTPTAAGEQSFTGKFKFAVCQDEACSPVTEELEFKVAVK